MLRKTAKYVAGAIMFAGFMLMLGTVGGMDMGTIAGLSLVKGLVGGVVLFVGGFFALMLAGSEEVPNEY